MPNTAVLPRPKADLSFGYSAVSSKVANRGRHLYAVADEQARPHLTPPPPRVIDAPQSVKVEFGQLATELEDAASLVSSTRRLMRHRAFVAVLALGQPVVPLVLKRLQESDEMRPVWLRVMGSFEQAPPGAGEETIDAATDAWVQWGQRNGLI